MRHDGTRTAWESLVALKERLRVRVYNFSCRYQEYVFKKGIRDWQKGCYEPLDVKLFRHGCAAVAFVILYLIVSSLMNAGQTCITEREDPAPDDQECYDEDSPNKQPGEDDLAVYIRTHYKEPFSHAHKPSPTVNAAGKRMRVDASTTVPVMVDHPDGTVTVEQVPMFTTEKPYTDKEARTIVWIVFAVAGFFLWCMIYR